MVQKGYALSVGPHAAGYKGYYAQFYKPGELGTCPDCGQYAQPDSWNDTGHGTTPQRAVIMAAKILSAKVSGVGKTVVVPPPEAFK